MRGESKTGRETIFDFKPRCPESRRHRALLRWDDGPTVLLPLLVLPIGQLEGHTPSRTNLF